MVHIIYALVDPHTRVVRYVGQTHTTLTQRLHVHMLTAARGKNKHPVYDWIRRLGKTPPIIISLQEVTRETITCRRGSQVRYEDTIITAETKWMKRFRRTILNGIDVECDAYKRLTNGDEETQLRAS